MEQAQRAARAGAESGLGVGAGRADKGDDVVAQGGGDKDRPGFFLKAQDVVAGGHGFQRVQRADAGLLGQDAAFLGGIGVAQGQAQQEAVQLGFGQRVSAVRFDVVFGGDDEERVREGIGDAVGRHLLLFHAFQQAGLRLGGRPVDLVGQHDVGEDRAFAELELGGFLVENGRAGDVGGQQVGRKLDALEDQPQGAGEGFGEGGLADAGDVFDQHMAAGQKRGQGQFDGGALADDHRLDLVGDASASSRRRRAGRSGSWRLLGQGGLGGRCHAVGSLSSVYAVRVWPLYRFQ